MFHGPRDLLWIGCLTGLTLTQKFKSFILTPNTNSRTCWPKEISHVMSGTIFYLVNISLSSSTCFIKNFSLVSCSTMAKSIRNQKEEGVVSKSPPAMMNMSSFIATSSSAASSPIASKSPGMPIASGKPDSMMSVEPSSFDAASTSQVRLKDAYFGGLTEEQRWDPSQQEEEYSEDSDNPVAGTWYYKGELVGQNNKAWRNPLHKDPVLQLTRKIKRIRKRHGTTISTYRRTHRTAWKPSSPWVMKIYGKPPAILRKIWMWIWLFCECLWIPLFEQQFISEKTMARIFITRRTISGTLWNTYLVK